MRTDIYICIYIYFSQNILFCISEQFVCQSVFKMNFRFLAWQCLLWITEYLVETNIDISLVVKPYKPTKLYNKKLALPLQSSKGPFPWRIPPPIGRRRSNFPDRCETLSQESVIYSSLLIFQNIWHIAAAMSYFELTIGCVAFQLYVVVCH